MIGLAAIISMHKIQYFKGAVSTKSKFHGLYSRL